MKKLIDIYVNRLLYSEKDFKEKMFTLMTIIAVSSVFLAFLGDLLIGEHVGETAALGILVLLAALVAF